MPRQIVDVEMLELFKAELTLCKVTKGEVVAVLSGGEDQQEYAQAFMLAAQSLGATTFHLNVPKYGQGKVAGITDAKQQTIDPIPHLLGDAAQIAADHGSFGAERLLDDHW